MIDAIQRKALNVGKTGCYFLVALSIAEDAGSGPRDVLSTFVFANQKGAVDTDCFMRQPATLMESLCGGKWDIIKAGPGHPLDLLYVCRPGEFEALRFQRKPDMLPNGTFESEDDCAHFVRGNGHGIVVWDPMGESRTVKEGWLVSKRIFRRVA